MNKILRALFTTGIGAGEWLLRVYGAFFLAIGFAFFYWGGRGLLAYQRGVRAAWTEPLPCVLGLVAGALSLWAAKSMMFGKMKVRLPGESPELDATMDAAMELEKTDPAAANQLLDGYFMRQAEEEQRRRGQLRERAPHDVNAALELRRALAESLATNASARKEFAKDFAQEPKLIQEIEADDRKVQAELDQLDATIKRLRLRP